MVVPLSLGCQRGSRCFVCERLDEANFVHRREVFEQVSRIAGLGTEDELEIQFLQISDVGSVGGEAILDDNALQLGMKLDLG